MGNQSSCKGEYCVSVSVALVMAFISNFPFKMAGGISIVMFQHFPAILF